MRNLHGTQPMQETGKIFQFRFLFLIYNTNFPVTNLGSDEMRDLNEVYTNSTASVCNEPIRI